VNTTRHHLVLATLALAGAIALPGSAVAVASSPERCTIVGTDGADRIVGTEGPDVICGLGGNDVIVGGGGDDVIVGGPGDDRIVGGSGDDMLLGGEGRDRLSGGTGADVLMGEEDRDSLVGGAESDHLLGGGGRDAIGAGSSGDTCSGDPVDRVAGTCIQDTTAPAIDQVAVPSEVAAGTTIVFSWRVSDDSGLYDVAEGQPATTAFVGGPSGWVRFCTFGLPGRRVAGDEKTGVYEASCAIPSNVPSGVYSVFLGASDLYGNSTFDAGTEFAVVGGSADGSVPSVTDVRTDAASYAPGAVVTFTFRATDATGVAYVIPWAFGPNGRLVDDAGRLWLDFAAAERISGDANDGRYTVSLKLLDSAATGTYVLWFSVADVLDNREFTPTGLDGTAFGTFDVAG